MPEKKSKIEEVSQETVAVVSTTKEMPAKADETSYPIPNDAELNQPPVRTHRPDVAIAQTLAAGAGEHVPPSSDEVYASGRAKYDEVAASNAGDGEVISAEDAENPEKTA